MRAASKKYYGLKGEGGIYFKPLGGLANVRLMLLCMYIRKC